MTYMLGLDLGTTYTAAAVWRDGSAEMVALGTHSHVIPSVVHLRDDGTLITGEAAVRRSLSDPGRTAREFKRRLGDPTPILLGGTPLAAVDLMTALLRDVLAAVSERHGGPPTAVALTHPANWGQFKIDLLRQAADACGLRDVTLVTEPVAAAVDYAAGARVPVGEVVAVYDLGGGTFDAAVLRRTASGFETLGEPVGLERLGGIDFDHAVVAHVERSISETLQTMDRKDPEVAGALSRLRQECVTAKEGLSEDSEVVVPVALPGVWSEVRLTRGEFEQMIAPALVEPLRAFRRGVASAGISANDIHTVLLVGGSSRVPLVAETVAGELGRPVAVDTHPKHAVALGAARIVGTKGAAAKPAVAAKPAATATPAATVTPADPPATEPKPAAVPAAARTTNVRRPRRRRRMVFAGVAAVAALAAGAGAFVTLGGSQGSASPAAPTDCTGHDLGGAHRGAIRRNTPRTTSRRSNPIRRLPRRNTHRRLTCVARRAACAPSSPASVWREIATSSTTPPPVSIRSSTGRTPVRASTTTTSTSSSTRPMSGNAGTNGQPPGSWEVWGLQRGGGELVFDEFTVDDAGDAEQLCVAVATSGHEILADAELTGNCVALPR